MRFKQHWNVDGKHAFLGASKYHWINDDLDKLKKRWENQFASDKGQRIHRLAAQLIKERVTMERNEKTLNRYVNDAIGFRMTPELVLYYSENCFGTADALSFDRGILRIHDLKTGVHPGSVNQLLIYAALFCLEYKINPYDIEMYGAIYQLDQVFPYVLDPAEVQRIMDWIRELDPVIEEMKEALL